MGYEQKKMRKKNDQEEKIEIPTISGYYAQPRPKSAIIRLRARVGHL